LAIRFSCAGIRIYDTADQNAQDPVEQTEFFLNLNLKIV
jgi:hypothetical protein